MEINNIIEISVGITIAILGIAYPILIDKTSSIGNKYQSDYLPEVFKKELSQRYFKIILIASLISFIFLIFNFKPLFGWNNFFINNSAKFITFFLSIILVVFFFLWSSKVLLYSGKSTILLNYIISKYDKSNLIDKEYLLKTINEFAFYSIKRKDEHIQETLVNFYSIQFSKILQTSKDKPIYRYDLYNLVYRISLESTKNKDHYLPILKNRAISGLWLLGEGFDEKEISNETYNWLWRILNIIAVDVDYVHEYWSTAHQHINYKLTHLMQDDYDPSTDTFGNQELVDKREKEIDVFIKFHFAFGGLLLYKKNYEAIKNIFSFTQSLPPDYPLLPNDMTTIFENYEYFINEYSSEHIEYSYPFFGIKDNFGKKMRYWIGSYITLLFIRQFFVQQYYIYQEPTSQPILPDKITELNNWLRRLKSFKFHLSGIIKNKELLNVLDYPIDESTLNTFIDDLEANIINVIEQKEYSREISPEKFENFKTSTGQIICDAFKSFSGVLNDKDISIDNKCIKYVVNGITTLHPKDAFSSDVEHLNYNSFFAKQVANRKIKYFISNSFFSVRTKRYLVNKNEIKNAIDRLKIDKTYVIIAIRPNYQLLQDLDKYKEQIVTIDGGSQSIINNTIFVLKKDDLPYLKFKKVKTEVIEQDQLVLLDNCDYPIYVSLKDLNKDENSEIRNKWLKIEQISEIELRKQVELIISFIAQIIWKENRKIVQISIKSQFKEQGISNNLSDIESVETKPAGNTV